MHNIIVLGDGGRAPRGIRQALDVEEEHVYDLADVEKFKRKPAQDGNLIRTGVPTGPAPLGTDPIHTVNWIGHGNPSRLLLPGNECWDPEEAAPFFDALRPQKIVLWACNTGIPDLSKKPRGDIRKAYQKDRTSMKVTCPRRTYLRNRTKSYARRLSDAMGEQGVDVYGAQMGLPPGGIGNFDQVDGPGSMVHWRSGQQVRHTSGQIAVKYNKVAVIWNRQYRIICKYKSRLVDGARVLEFTYYSKYVDL
jgi:hypothetical protein